MSAGHWSWFIFPLCNADKSCVSSGGLSLLICSLDCCVRYVGLHLLLRHAVNSFTSFPAVFALLPSPHTLYDNSFVGRLYKWTSALVRLMSGQEVATFGR